MERSNPAVRTTRRVPRIAGLVAVAAIGVGLAACSQMLTSTPPSGDVFDGPLEGLTPAEQAAFVEGDAQFGRPFSIHEGLGPIFNNVSCASCHSGDGRGRPENALLRFSLGLDPALSIGGPQLQDKAIPGAEAETVPAGVDQSLRLPPPVFGVGLIEAIPEAAILASADPDDLDGNGISGRANMVTPPAFVGAAGPVLGRFSRKAQVGSILEQVVAAYHQDIGITSDFEPHENTNPLASVATEAADKVADPELPAAAVRSVVAYLRMLAAPTPGPMTATRERGQQVFGEVGCAGCHRPSYRTGTSSIAALSDRDVFLYSDLLLHDMGDELADNRPDGQATGHEWRTTPLWGLRIMTEFLNGQMFLLHDGRARNLPAAIGAHGGEAAASRAAYDALSETDRAALHDFVLSR